MIKLKIKKPNFIRYEVDNCIIYNEDCFKTMQRMVQNNVKCDIILTSPPYNTGRCCKTERSINDYENRYDSYLDNLTDSEYSQWTVNLFNMYNQILNPNSTILYNISYGNENPNLLWNTISDIIKQTNFMVADCIVWKKKCALPNNVSSNKLTRITEFIFVFCRKSEYKTFNANKKIKSISRTGQNYYESVFNFIEARNNDGSCKLNKATYSTELCEKLLSIYAKPGCTVYDSFIGTGTTAVACKNFGLKCFGSEMSKAQCMYAQKRLKRCD